uniref:B30.2/SPRY domain-containing protein n=1 Tax=Noctiluca scintillans TaxID=2966 RepID=A0A7S1EZW4_NOCSC
MEEVEKDTTVAPASARVKHEVRFDDYDSTLDVLFGANGRILSSLSKGGFQHLLSGVRGNTGAKSGRYVFEAQVLESEGPVTLRLGFSTAKSSLFLGDGSLDNVSFDLEGSFLFCEPGATQLRKATGAIKAITTETLPVIAVLLNLTQDESLGNTVSVFVDGQRAGPPQPLPQHLRGKALYPTITFKNAKLAVNLGAGLFKALPFACPTFADIATEDHESASFRRPADNETRVVVPVGLPDGGVFDFVDRFMEDNPGYVELSDRALRSWAIASGLESKEEGCRDDPEFSFGVPALDEKSIRPMLKTLAMLNNRSCVVTSIKSSLLQSDRVELLKSFPESTKKTAVVLVGEPNAPFKDWVQKKIRSNYEARKDFLEKRKALVAATGEMLSEEDTLPLEEPRGDSVFLPRSGNLPDLTSQIISRFYAKFSLPVTTDGFQEVRHEWLGEQDAKTYLQKWIQERKTTLIVEGLVPSPWFAAKIAAWRSFRSELRDKHVQFTNKKSQAKSAGVDLEVGMCSLDSASVHDADEKGTPLYANFKYEDWLILSWRIELHLLATGFLNDVDDPERLGIPEDHVAHYYELYHELKLTMKKLNCDTLPQTVKLLKEPTELISGPGDRKFLRSTLDKETDFDVFVRGVESYRRDRLRRIEAGDESAQLKFPKPMPKAAAPKGAPAKGVVKAPVTKAPVAKGPVAKGPVAKVACSPVRTVVTKSPAAATAGVKRPVVDAVANGGPALKKLRPEGSIVAKVAKTPGVNIAKAPVAKVAVAKVAVAKRPPVA